MSKTTREINKITTAIISLSLKLIIYALIILLLYEAVIRGFAFGHSIFYAEAAEEPPGREVAVHIPEGETAAEAAGLLKKEGLIKSEFSFIFQSRFYDYEEIYPGDYTLNTSMTSKEILQKLNEKPVEDDAASGKSKAEVRESTGGQTEDEGVQAAAETAGQTAAVSETGSLPSEEDSAGGTADTGGEDDAEGGWIEDISEDDP